LGIPVVEYPKLYMNFPSTHALHAGYDPSGLLADADVVLVVECDAPWLPKTAKLRDNVKVVQIDEDPVFQDYPYWGFGIDIALKGTPSITLDKLLAETSKSRDKPSAEQVQARIEKVKGEHDSFRNSARKSAEASGSKKPIAKDWVSLKIQELKSPSTIVVNEYDMNPALVDFDVPGTFFSESPAGCLGLGLGMSLGIKFAKPKSDLIFCVGEGSYIFGNPVASHWVSAEYNVPFLTVIYDDHSYSSVKGELLALHPSGWAAKTKKFPGLDFSHRIDFRHYVEAVGGAGHRVEDPAKLEETLRTAMNEVHSGRQVVVDVICS
jgi:acetolactate synthase-1/2/3 large subunit